MNEALLIELMLLLEAAGIELDNLVVELFQKFVELLDHHGPEIRELLGDIEPLAGEISIENICV